MGREDKELIVEAVMGNLHTVVEFVEAAANAAGCPEKIIKQIVVVIEELFVNIASYAYEPETGLCTLQLQTEQTESGGRIRMCLRDKGREFNPLLQELPDVTESAEERRIGGLGILIVRTYVDKVDYRYTDGENIVSVEKSWAGI
jgi:anti-sigma regulatory factor (Ser/Thr protein kinase)